MSRIKTYSNIPMSLGGAAPIAGPASVSAATVISTNGIPAKGARLVIGRLIGTDANAWVNTNLWVGMNASRSIGFVTPPTGYSLRTGSGRADQGAITFILEAAAGTIWHDFVQLWATAHATLNHTGVVVSAQVYYEAEADLIMQQDGQYNLAMLTT